MKKMKIEQSGVINSFEQLKKKLMSKEHMGKVMQVTAARMWVPLIKERLGVRTGTSKYDAELEATMKKLDPLFVAMLAGQSLNSSATSAWADRTEAERRAPGGYSKGMITEAIDGAIRAYAPRKVPGGLVVGIGKYERLDNLFGSLGVERQWKLWQILNYGTGTLGASGTPVIRTGKQIFYNRKMRKGVLAYTTSNPGFKGREFFVKMDGSMHQGDYMVKRTIIRYMNNVIKQLSYRKSNAGK